MRRRKRHRILAKTSTRSERDAMARIEKEGATSQQQLEHHKRIPATVFVKVLGTFHNVRTLSQWIEISASIDAITNGVL